MGPGPLVPYRAGQPNPNAGAARPPNSRRERAKRLPAISQGAGRIVNRDVEAGTQNEVAASYALDACWGGTFATQHH